MVGSSDEEEEEEEELFRAGGPRASWMATPEGSPKMVSEMVSLEINNPVPPAPPPPAYYTLPLSADSFDFPPAVVQFLQDLDVGPKALCKIAVARDYDMESWGVQFGSAGLSEDVSKILRELFVQALTPEQHAVLHLTAPSSPVTSVGTESSIESWETV